MRFLVFKMPAILYMALIYYLSSKPVTSPLLNQIPDYFLHSVEYAGLYVLLFLAIHEDFSPAPGHGGYWLPILCTVCYGASDEFHQSFIPLRDSSLLDLASDLIGGMLGVALVWITERIIPDHWFGLRNIFPRRKVE